jgi:hypothetical protein
MDSRARARLSAEPLGDRTVPAVSAIVSSGTLLVTGSAVNAGDTITVTQTAPGAFTVTDGGTPVTVEGSGPVNNVDVRLGRTSDTVGIDLGGFTLPGSVSASLGGGTDSLTVSNGTINGDLGVRGGPGRDTVTVADPLTVNGALAVATSGGDDTVSVGAATIAGGASFDLAGGDDTLTFRAAVGSGAGRVLDVDAGSGNDAVELLAPASIRGDGRVDLGYGRDAFTFADDGTALTAELLVRGGPGKDTYVGTLPRPGVTAEDFEF